MSFTRVASLEDLWGGEMKGFVVDGVKVLLIRMEDSVYAYEDRCAHQGVQLSKGRLESHVLTCSAHEFQYDARSGKGINPESVCLKKFTVKLQQNEIFVDVSHETQGIRQCQ